MKRLPILAALVALAGCAAPAAPAPAPTTPAATVVASPTPTKEAVWTVNGDISVEGDYSANLARDNSTVDGPCQVEEGYDDIAEGRSVVIRDSKGETVAIGDLGAVVLAVVEGETDMRMTYCRAHFSVDEVPRGRGFYSVEVGSRGEVEFSEEALFDSPQLTLGDVPE